MEVLSLSESRLLRDLYIQEFVDTDSEFYTAGIIEKELYNDGRFYSGYLWDCFKRVEVKSDFFCKEFLSDKDRLYLFWDLHSSERVPFWEGRNVFPLESVLQLDFTEYMALKSKLPEDVYIFDETFLWSIVFTHETDSKGRPFNYFVTP